MASDDHTRFNQACINNDVETVRTFLERPDARDLYESCPNTSLYSLAFTDSDRVIPLIACKFPEGLETEDSDGHTPFLVAARQFHTKAMMAFVTAGANLSARDIKSRNALELACTNQTSRSVVLNPNAYKHLLALRSLGFEMNAPDEHGRSPFRKALETGALDPMKRCLDAGGNLYKALQLPAPDNPLNLNYNVANLHRRLGLTVRSDYHENITSFAEYIHGVMKAAPPPGTPLDPSLFLEPGGEPTKPSLQWEALSILPLYFAPDAAHRWKGGLAELVETAGRMPSYMHDTNLQRTERETPLARTDSITAAYAGNTRPRPTPPLTA